MHRVGTLDQQLTAVSLFLRVPRDVRDRLDPDDLWDHVLGSVMTGETGKPIDGDFREIVRRMRDAQRRVLNANKRYEREDAIVRARELERQVDQELGPK